MELALLVYGISVTSSFATFCVLLSTVLFIITFGRSMKYVSDLDFCSSFNNENLAVLVQTKKSIVRFGGTALLLAFLTVLIPSEKTMYVMVGAYAAQKISQAPETKVISEKVLKVIEQKLDEQINEVTDNKSK